MIEIDKQYFYREIIPGLFLIGCEKSENDFYVKSYHFGGPTGNSWLLIGKKKAILVDSAEPVQGLKTFVESLVNVPVMFVLSHAHFDHTFQLKEFDEFWMHPADEKLLHGAEGMPEYIDIPSKIHYLEDGDVIDLGDDHQIQIKNIKGHSDGSILLLDKKLKVLISGDTIARRLLFFSSTTLPIRDYIEGLNNIKNEDFDLICSCHDRVPLKKDYINFILDNLISIKDSQNTRKLFDDFTEEFYSFKIGDDKTDNYLSCSIQEKYKNLLVETLGDYRKGSL